MLKHIKIADVSTKQLVINGHKRGALTHLLEAEIMGDDCVELTAFNQPTQQSSTHPTQPNLYWQDCSFSMFLPVTGLDGECERRWKEELPQFSN